MSDQTRLAQASFSITPGWNSHYGNFYSGMDSINQSLGLAPEKLIIPRDYHSVVRMSYDFYQRGGLASTVINRLAELTITSVRNGQRGTGEEANEYFSAILNRNPSRMMRFIRSAALEYFLSGMVLPKVSWQEIEGKDISPKLTKNKKYLMPVFDMYPPLLVNVVWANWGKKEYYLKLPKEDIKLIKNGGSTVKEQQLKYNMYVQHFPQYVDTIRSGADRVLLEDVDPILRKEISINPYPTPYLYNVLEALVFKQSLRRMDFAVASRVINAILLVQEGNDAFPLTKETESNLDELKAQILARAGDYRSLERLFFLFSNHTTKLTWITPEVQALLDQEKYRQTNEEIAEGLGFARILVTGESRNAQAAELSTWSIQPMMEELRAMLIEWMTEIYEEAAELNGFRNPPAPAFTPIKLQDFVKTAAVFAQAYREGNVSRTTRDEMIGLDFKTELELIKDEKTGIDEIDKLGKFPSMPYNTQVVPGAGGIGGAPNARNGGRPTGTQNVPVNKRNSGVRPPGQSPASKGKQTKSPTSKAKASVEWSEEEILEALSNYAEQTGRIIGLEDIGFDNPPENE